MIAIKYKLTVVGRGVFFRVKEQAESVRHAGEICSHEGIEVHAANYPWISHGPFGNTISLRGFHKQRDNMVTAKAMNSAREAFEMAEKSREAILKAMVTLHQRGFLRNEDAGN